MKKNTPGKSITLKLVKTNNEEKLLEVDSGKKTS